MGETTVACPACGQSNPDDKRFCGDCGAALARQSLAGAPEKERRLVTILFSDLVGSTALGETLDPEEVDEVVGSAQTALADVVRQYGGHVAKFLGDGLMALFGAPIAHEDDAERAVLVALQMHQALTATNERRPPGTPPLEMRVGITSGEVIASGSEGSYDVIGDAANTAARLQSAADIGGVLVGAETMRLAQRRIRFGERRELSLKGKAGAVAAYPVLGLRERLAERWETRAERTPLTGRDRELNLLLDAWRRAQAGEGQLITLIGDAGVGKSRLIGELVERVTRDSAPQVIRGRCLSYGQEISLWLVADLVRALFGIGEQDSPEVRRHKVTLMVTSLFAGENGETQLPDPEPAKLVAIDVLGEVLGSSPGGSIVGSADAQVRRQALIRSLQVLLRALSGQAPALLVLEDLHWIDAASAEVLSEIMIEVPALPVLVLASQRPGWTAPWTEWGWPERLSLQPMDERDTALLAGAVLGGSRPSATLERYVQERTGGNPYFIEELLRALQANGGLVEEDGQVQLVPGVADQVPTTLTEILLARLDRLEAEVRSLAQVASVVGRSFAVRLLAQIVERNVAALQTPLSSLQRAEVAFPHRARELEYVFKHATLREVAYNTLLKKRRQQIHAATAQAIASLYPTDEYVEMIAYHFSKTEQWEEAARWLERAGDRAAEVYANDMAIKHYEEARNRLERLETEGDAATRLDEKLGAVFTTVGQYDRALAALARAAGDSEGEARVLGQAGQVHYHRGSSEEGIATLRAFLGTVEERGPQAVTSNSLAPVYAALTLLYFATGRYDEELAAAEQAAELARAVGDEHLLARAEVSRALALLALGHRQDAQKVLEGAIPLAEADLRPQGGAAGDLETLARALDNLSNVHYFRGEFEQSRLYLERGLEVAERMGDPAMIGHMLFMLGTNAFWVGNWSTSRACFQRDSTIIRALGKSRVSALPLYGMGQLSLHEGDWEAATRYLEEVIRLVEESGNLPILKWAHRMLAERELREGEPAAALARLAPLLARPGLEQSATLLAPLAQAHMELGNEEEAEQAVAQAMARATADDDRIDLSDALHVSALLAIRRHRWEDARHTLEEALELARSMNYPYGEAAYLYAYGVMCREQGNLEQSRQRLQQALAIFRRLGARKDIERTEQAIATSSELNAPLPQPSPAPDL